MTGVGIELSQTKVWTAKKFQKVPKKREKERKREKKGRNREK